MRKTLSITAALLAMTSAPQAIAADAKALRTGQCQNSVRTSSSSPWHDAPCQYVVQSSAGNLAALAFVSDGGKLFVTYYFPSGQPQSVKYITLVTHANPKGTHLSATGACEMNPGPIVACRALVEGADGGAVVNVAHLPDSGNEILYVSR